MKLWINLDRIESVESYLSMQVDALIVGISAFSCRQALTLEDTRLKDFYHQLNHRAKLYILVNSLIDEDRLSLLEEKLEILHTCCDGLLFQDFAVYQIVKRKGYDLHLVYSPETLNTNYRTIETLSSLGIDTFFLSREISLEALLNIRQHTKHTLMVALHGPMYQAYSKRPLLSNYFASRSQQHDVGQKAHLSIVPQDSAYESYIYEDGEGTHIVSKERLYTIDLLASLQSFDVGYIDLMYHEPLEAIEVVSLYHDALIALEEGAYLKDVQEWTRLLKALNSSYTYSHGFYFDGTLYRLEDVRMKENEGN